MAHYGGYPQQYGDPAQPQYPTAPDPYGQQNPPAYGAAPAGVPSNPADPYAPPYGSTAGQPDPYAGAYNTQQGYGSPASGYPTNATADYGAYGAQYAAAPASAPPPSYPTSNGYDQSQPYPQQYPSGQPYHDPYAHQQYPTGQPYHDPYAQPQGYYDSGPHDGGSYGRSAYGEYDPYEDQRYTSSGGYDRGGHYSDSKDDQLLAKVYEDQKYVARTKASSKSSNSSSNTNKDKLESGPGGIERFKVTLVPWDGAEPEFDRVVQVGLDGISILELSSKKTLRTYRLDAISRWALKDKEIFTFWHKEDNDQNEQTVRIMASEKTNRTILDTLTTCCFQLCEIRGLQPDFGSGGAGGDTTNILASQARKTAPKASDGGSSDKEADKDVEFWEDPEHEGWLMKQGEHIKTWRRRWFILKQGRMFWFKEHRVSSRSVTRGIIRLKEIMEVKMVDKARGFAPNTFEIVVKGDKGAASQYFTADTETEMVGWISEIESRMPGASNGKQELNRGGSSHAELAQQLQKDLERMSVGRR